MLYKELERQLKEKESTLSPNKAIEIASNIYQIEVPIPNKNKTYKHILLLHPEQINLAKLFEF